MAMIFRLTKWTATYKEVITVLTNISNKLGRADSNNDM